MTGVEGYVESAASGLVAGINLAHKILGKGEVVFPRETMIGSMAYYISHAKNNKNFQPMNANFGLLPSLETRIKDKKNAMKHKLIELWITRKFQKLYKIVRKTRYAIHS